MDNPEAISLIVGIVMPLVITIIKQAGLERWVNFAITILVCAAAGTLTAWACGQLNPANILGSIAAVFAASQAVYAAYWKGSDVESEVNEKTSIIK
jgi:membrane associated rhomboid family serine protease